MHFHIVSFDDGMALEATHIRFAVDLKDHLKVNAFDTYISGSVYPDSRYITEIDRVLTHPKDYTTNPFFNSTDFRKGWFAHLLCDDIQSAVMKEFLPQTMEGDPTQVWVQRTAIKVLQDIDDAPRFPLEKFLPYLSYVENPNGEDLETLQKYNHIFLNMYAHPESVSIVDAIEMWRQFGVGEELVERVRVCVEDYRADADVMSQIANLYPEMVRRARQK